MLVGKVSHSFHHGHHLRRHLCFILADAMARQLRIDADKRQ